MMSLDFKRFVDIYIGIPLVYICRLTRWCFRGSKKPRPDRGYQRVLLVKFWGIGNIAMLLPVVSAFKKKYPCVLVDFLTLKENTGIFTSDKIFNQVYGIDCNQAIRFIKSLFKNVKILRHNQYDLVIDFEQFARFSALVCLAIEAKHSIGFKTKGQCRHFFYTVPTAYNDHIHMTKSFMSLGFGAGIDPTLDVEPVAWDDESTGTAYIENILREARVAKDDFLVLLHLGTSENFIEKRWPVENFAKLADRLIDTFKVRIAFSGLPQESYLVQRALGLMKRKEQAINFCGRLNFSQYIALIGRSDLIISSDTASIHLGTAMSVAVVGLYGPTTPVLYGPWGKKSSLVYKKLPCSPCITNYNAKTHVCRHPDGRGACMKKISVDEVWDLLLRHYFNRDAIFSLRELHA